MLIARLLNWDVQESTGLKGEIETKLAKGKRKWKVFFTQQTAMSQSS